MCTLKGGIQNFPSVFPLFDFTLILTTRMNKSMQLLFLIWCFLFIRYGVVSLPEVNDWQPLTVNDSYLVAATDGIFEKLKPQDICDIFWELQTDTSVSSVLTDSFTYSLADRVVDAAFDKGTLDNMAAVVLPVKSLGTSQTLLKNVYDGAGKYDHSAVGYVKHFNKQAGNSRCDLASYRDLMLLIDYKRGKFVPFLYSLAL